MILDEYNILQKKNKKKGFAAFDLLIYIAIVLLAIIIFAFIIGKVNKSKTTETTGDTKSSGNEVVKLNGAAERIYYENLKNIKDAAISYFTNERLPQETGDKVVLSLKKMQDKKLVLNVIDSNDTLCDSEKSYVEVEKDTNEYVMKIYLSCSDKEDYIIVHLGCYDYCKDNICEKEDEEGQTEFEYEYKRVTDCEMTDWSKWSDWTKIRQKTSKFKKEESKVETKNEEYIDTTPAIEGTVYYSCEEYPGYELSGNLCVKTITTKDVIPAIEGEYSYNCDEYPGYLVEGSTCVKFEEKTETKSAKVVKGDYYCPEGYKLSGTECIKTVSKTDVIDATKGEPTYTCPSGYKQNGKNCTRTVTKTDTKGASPEYGTKTEYYSCNKQECTTKTVMDCSSGSCKMVPQTSCQTVQKTCSREVSYVTGYSCPSGYSLSGTTCTKSYPEEETIPATEGEPTYTCPSGYELTGTKCVKDYTKEEKIPASRYEDTYKCDKGYTLEGKVCTRNYIEKTVKDAKKVSGGYSCKEGYILNGDKCEKTNESIDTNPAKENKTKDNCPSGYTLSNGVCSKKVNKAVKTTYYRYATRTCEGGNTDIVWSYANNKDLLDNGYKLTGNKREIQSNVTEK